MGLLDKATNSAEETPKAEPVKPSPTTTKAAAAAPAKTVEKAVKSKAPKAKAPKAQPLGLSDDYELASILNVRITWIVNLIINFGLLVGAIAMNVFTGGAGNGGLVNTLMFLGAFALLIINILIIPMKFSRNIGQFVSRTKYVKSDGSNPNIMHGVLVNSLGLLFLLGLIMVIVNISKLGDADAKNSAIVYISIGSIFVILWGINRYLKNGSELNQGLFDLLFGAFLVKYVPSEEEKATGIWARLENMGNFGDQMKERLEKKQKKNEESS